MNIITRFYNKKRLKYLNEEKKNVKKRFNEEINNQNGANEEFGLVLIKRVKKDVLLDEEEVYSLNEELSKQEESEISELRNMSQIQSSITITDNSETSFNHENEENGSNTFVIPRKRQSLVSREQIEMEEEPLHEEESFSSIQPLYDDSITFFNVNSNSKENTRRIEMEDFHFYNNFHNQSKDMEIEDNTEDLSMTQNNQISHSEKIIQNVKTTQKKIQKRRNL